jgi:hypothetical protein
MALTGQTGQFNQAAYTQNEINSIDNSRLEVANQISPNLANSTIGRG